MANQIVQAVLLGGFYALVACGLSFMFAVMRIINLAHGSFAITAGYLIWHLADNFGISPFVGIAIVVPFFAAAGFLLQRFVLERAARGGELLPILATFGLSVVVDNLLFQTFGANTRSLAPYVGDLSWDSFELPGGIFAGKLSVLILIVAVLLIGMLSLFLKSTQLGRAIRATAQDPDTAGLVGINPRFASGVAAAVALATVAIAGAFIGMRGIFDAYSGAPQLLFAFETTVIGGTRSLWGTLWGGILLALAQTIGAGIHPQGFLIGGHLAFLAVLFIRLFRARELFRTRSASRKKPETAR